jgi:hypothetical protein
MFPVGHWKEPKRIYLAYVPRGTLEGRHRPPARGRFFRDNNRELGRPSREGEV